MVNLWTFTNSDLSWGLLCPTDNTGLLVGEVAKDNHNLAFCINKYDILLCQQPGYFFSLWISSCQAINASSSLGFSDKILLVYIA